MAYKNWICALFLGVCGMATAQSRVLYDVRVPTPQAFLPDADAQQIRSVARKAEQAHLWKGQADCAGQSLSIEGMASGAFTTPNIKQNAYLYTTCFVVPNVSRQGLVIMQDHKIVAHYVFTDHFKEVYGVKDVNKNGYSELGFIRRLEGQGTANDYLMLAELRPNRRFLLAEKVNYNDCGNMGTAGWTSQLIRVLPSSLPTFTKQLLTGTCDDVEPFRRLTGQGTVKTLTAKQEPTGWVAAPTY